LAFVAIACGGKITGGDAGNAGTSGDAPTVTVFFRAIHS